MPEFLTPGCFWMQKSGDHGCSPFFCGVFLLFLVHRDADFLLSMAMPQKNFLKIVSVIYLECV